MKNKRTTPRQATSSTAFTYDKPVRGDPLLSFRPVRHTAPRRNSITPPLQRAFIAHLAATGIVVEAARHIGRSTEALYNLRQRKDAGGFRAAWDAAIDRGVSRLEAGALARAIEGEERHIVSGGKIVATERRFNAGLIMFFLRNRLAERYDQHKDIGPGHPVYERVRRDYAAEQARGGVTAEEVRASIDRKVDDVRQQIEARKGG